MNDPMTDERNDGTRVAVIGGGPAGLYFGLLLKQAMPGAKIRIVERNRPDDTFGWGVVFSEETLSHFGAADPPSYAAIQRNFVRWSCIDTHFRGEVIRSSGHAFVGISRRKLLQLLQERCAELGVEMAFSHEATGPDSVGDADLVVAADGINSRTRDALAEHFRPRVVPGRSKFIWLGTRRLFEAFTFIFRENEHGFFQVHAYSFDADSSTFIIETDEETFRNAGFDRLSVAQTLEYCERLFSPELQGHRLLENNSRWINFREVKNERWYVGNVVLIGDAAHTAHFSIGSGTKLAMEDSIALAKALAEHATIPEALAAYQEARWLDVAKLQRAAQTSQRWFEDIKRYRTMEPLQLTFSMLSRSKRITHENLAKRDPELVQRLDRWLAEQAGVSDDGPVPPMFLPFSLRGLHLRNRIVVSAMCQYSADEGLPNDWHLVHIGSRAMGGAGMVMTEMTDVSAAGRISPRCAGLYTAEHAAAWTRIVSFVHDNSPAKIGLQLGHAGPKGSAHVPWEHDGRPLDANDAYPPWPLLAASAIPYDTGWPVPKAMDRADMDEVREQFVSATKLAVGCGFDLIELHFGHGYLLSSFISPLSNRRTDEYGGSVENRMRFPVEILRACRAVWPSDRPISVRFSACDWAPGGLDAAGAVEVARLLAANGCDIVDVSTGQTTPAAAPEYGRMYQAPFSDRIRHEVGIPTMSVGAIENWDHANTVIAAGRADLCAMARPHLYDPYLTLHAAAEQGVSVPWPEQYRRGSRRPSSV